LLILGGAQYTGAPALAAYAARRVGAGYVTLFCPSQDYPLYAGHSGGAVVKGYDHFNEVLDFYRNPQCQGVVVGPGLLPIEDTQKQVLSLLSIQKTLVLDGGALSCFRGNPQILCDAIHSQVILTPHQGEWERLFPAASGQMKADALEYILNLSEGVWVLKGFETLIGTKGNDIVSNTNARASLATAGTGDVLAGMIGGLIVQGMPPFEGACAGVYLHGCASQKRGRGLIAEDIPDFLPDVFAALNLD